MKLWLFLAAPRWLCLASWIGRKTVSEAKGSTEHRIQTVLYALFFKESFMFLSSLQWTLPILVRPTDDVCVCIKDRHVCSVARAQRTSQVQYWKCSYSTESTLLNCCNDVPSARRRCCNLMDVWRDISERIRDKVKGEVDGKRCFQQRWKGPMVQWEWWILSISERLAANRAVCTAWSPALSTSRDGMQFNSSALPNRWDETTEN